MRILGVDPGSRLTGYGVIDLNGRDLKHVTSGTLKLANPKKSAEVPLEERLLLLFNGLSDLIREYEPQTLVLERVFFAKNALSTLKLGQARGVALLCGSLHRLQVVEYSATEVKSIVVGHGQASKDQVAKMVQVFLGQGMKFATADASDALALALCHTRFVRSPVTLALSKTRGHDRGL